MKEAFANRGKKVEYHDYHKYRISYITEKDAELMFLFVTGLTDNFENIKKELIKCKKEFLNLFEEVLDHKIDEKTFEIFDPTIDLIHRNLRPKISLIGFSGVGKTTITRLIKAEEIPMQHIPTITGDIATIKIGKLHFHLWDFAGQEQFSYLWNNFIKGSDAVLLITDSTLENIEKSKFFLELIKEQAPQAHTSVIGNKQDLNDAMKPEQIEKILGLKTYSMIANDSNNRDKMITIIADVLEMNAEVSPLLKPLLERDTYMEKATNALENAEFGNAATFFDKISDLCIELGDDSLGKEFYEKSQKIKSMLQKLSVPQPDSPEEPTKPVKKRKVKKSTIPKTPKSKKQEKREVPVVIPPPPPPSQKLFKAPEESENEVNVKKPSIPPVPRALKKQKVIEKTIVPPQLNKLAPPKIPKTEELEPEPEALIKPKIPQKKVELAIKPDDFMVKTRPKTVMTVPKDAKTKLKTSPFAQVTNPTRNKTPVPVSPTELIKAKPPASFTPTKKIDTPKIPKKNETQPPKVFEIPKKITQSPTLVSPTELIKPKTKAVAVTPSKVLSAESTTTTQKTVEPTVQTTSIEISKEQKANLENSLMDLKIKKTNISKMSLDFDMKELTGEITSKELEEKKSKLEAIKAGLKLQIKELEQLLKK